MKNSGTFFTEAAAAEMSSSIIPAFHRHRPSGAEPPAVQSVILQDVVNLRQRIVCFAELLGRTERRRTDGCKQEQHQETEKNLWV